MKKDLIEKSIVEWNSFWGENYWSGRWEKSYALKNTEMKKFYKKWKKMKKSEKMWKLLRCAEM